MSEQLPQTDEGGMPGEMQVQAEAGRITLLEAMAEDTEAVGIDRSNHSTQQADFDDQ